MADYPALTTDEASKIKKTADELQKALGELKKKADKSLKAKLDEVQKNFELGVKKLSGKLLQDMKIAKAGANTMSLQIETFLGQSVGFLKTTKDAYAKYLKTNDPSQIMVIEGGPGTIETIARLAAAEMNKFAVSWDKYRQLNVGYLEATKDSNTLRQEVMNITKIARGKVDRMEQLAEEARSVLKMAKEASATTAPTAESKRGEAQALATKIREMSKALTDGKGNAEATAAAMTKFPNKFTDKVTLKSKKAFTGVVTESQKVYAFAVSSVGMFTKNLASMKIVLDNGKKMIPDEYLKDGATAASMKTAQQTYEHCAYTVKMLQTGLNTMAGQLTKAQNDAKAMK